MALSILEGRERDDIPAVSLSLSRRRPVDAADDGFTMRFGVRGWQ
jgi:hypothetical protein